MMDLKQRLNRAGEEKVVAAYECSGLEVVGHNPFQQMSLEVLTAHWRIISAGAADGERVRETEQDKDHCKMFYNEVMVQNTLAISSYDECVKLWQATHHILGK